MPQPLLRRALLLALAALSATGCGSDPAEQWNSERSAASRFSDRVTYRSLERTSPELAAQQPSWDFSRARSLAFVFHQEQHHRRELGTGADFPAHSEEQSAIITGRLLIESTGAGDAVIMLRDLETHSEADGSPPRALEDYGVAVIDEHGRGRFASSTQDTLLQLLFPVPPETLAVGESVSVPASLPVRFGGSLLRATGEHVITLHGAVRYDGHECLLLTSEIVIDELPLPGDLPGRLDAELLARGAYLYAPEERAFRAGRLAARILIDERIELLATDGGSEPEIRRTRSVSDQFIELAP